MSLSRMAKHGVGVHPTGKLAFALIADQDLRSTEGIGNGKFRSYLKTFVLKYEGDLGKNSYQFSPCHEIEFLTTEGEGKPGEKRGAEYSAIEYFDGKFLIMCDKTGNIDELVPQRKNDLVNTPWIRKPLFGKNGEQVYVSRRRGSDEKMKIEWATVKNGKLIIGSHGNIDGTHQIVQVKKGSYDKKMLDGKTLYKSFENATCCKRGYLTHEACRWSEKHKKFFFIPRKLSKTPFDEKEDEKACANIMLATADLHGKGQVESTQYALEKGQRGCSDFLFIPGTADCHILLVRTVEKRRGDGEYDDLDTYLSVIDLEGNVLMEETSCGSGRKFEGAVWLGSFTDESDYEVFFRRLSQLTTPCQKRRRM